LRWVFRTEKDAIPITNEANSVRNLVTENGRRYLWLQLCLTVAFALLLVPATALGQTFVQIADNLPGTGSTTTFTTPENAGDLNVVIVAWDGSTSVTSVTDSNGNNYVLAGTTSGEGLAQAIYYARNISVATTTTPTVTVNFVKAQSDSDVRVAEYTGFSSAAVTVDNWIGNAGGNNPATSNNMTTSTSSLIVGAGAAVNAFAPGGIPPGLTSRGINTFGNVTMDSNGHVPAGTYAAGANVVSQGWVMQAAGFSINGITTVTPTVTQIAPNTGGVAGGDPVTITGTNFANGAVALFGTAPGGLALLNCVVTASTTMSCNTPPDNEGIKDVTVVNVDGKNGSLIGGFTYSINDPVISGVSPATTTTDGTILVTITGSNFEPGAQVNVGGPLPQAGNGVFGDNPTVVSSTTMTFTTPALSVGPADVEVRNPDGGAATDGGALTYTLGTGPINYIQRADAATGSTAQNVPATMTNPQTKGNLNVIIIGWSNGAVISSVTDNENNAYVPALPVTSGTSLNQAIYYAKNIVGDNVNCAPNCNTITVTFNTGAASPDLRVLEYSGLDPNNPLDQVAGAAGSGPTADTGACSNTTASELIVAGATVGSEVTAAGSGFTTVDYTFNGDNAEQQITTAISSCEATTVLVSGNWVIQSVSFKAGVAGPPSYTITAVPPTSQTVTAGDNASYALTLAEVNGFNSSVTLSCTGLPTGATCEFQTSPVTPGSSTADTVTITTTGSTPAGTSTVTITGTPTPKQTATVSLTVNAGPGFTLGASPTSATIGTPGGSATSTISITPTGGFSASVALSCGVSGGGSPAATCSLSPTSIAPGATSTLTVNTTANTASNPPRSTGLFYALLLPIGGMTLLGAGFSSRRKKLLGILLIGMLIAGFIFMTACSSGSSSGGGGGGGGGGTPAGTYTVTVTGTSGSLTPTTTFTVTVQ
jgi:hypothetical protein